MTDVMNLPAQIQESKVAALASQSHNVLGRRIGELLTEAKLLSLGHEVARPSVDDLFQLPLRSGGRLPVLVI